MQAVLLTYLPFLFSYELLDAVQYRTDVSLLESQDDGSTQTETYLVVLRIWQLP